MNLSNYSIHQLSGRKVSFIKAKLTCGTSRNEALLLTTSGQIKHKLHENNLRTIKVSKENFNLQWKVKRYFTFEL